MVCVCVHACMFMCVCVHERKTREEKHPHYVQTLQNPPQLRDAPACSCHSRFPWRPLTAIHLDRYTQISCTNVAVCTSAVDWMDEQKNSTVRGGTLWGNPQVS